MSTEVRGPGLYLTVTDDGHGGADPRRGTGLTGLRDRVEALGGTLAVDNLPRRRHPPARRTPAHRLIADAVRGPAGRAPGRGPGAGGPPVTARPTGAVVTTTRSPGRGPGTAVVEERQRRVESVGVQGDCAAARTLGPPAAIAWLILSSSVDRPALEHAVLQEGTQVGRCAVEPGLEPAPQHCQLLRLRPGEDLVATTLTSVSEAVSRLIVMSERMSLYCR
ncbi:hypothetical protein GCM10020218_027720 [Dactylosporangium vinaceum]